jgi:hypothetical protein
MAINFSAEASAPDKKMTLDELREFVRECDRFEVPGGSHLEVTTKGLNKLRKIQVVRQ